MPLGNEPIPTAERACLPRSPSTSTSRSEHPLITLGCCPKSGSALTMPSSLTTTSIRSSEPNAYWLVKFLHSCHRVWIPGRSLCAKPTGRSSPRTAPIASQLHRHLLRPGRSVRLCGLLQQCQALCGQASQQPAGLVQLGAIGRELKMSFQAHRPSANNATSKRLLLSS